MIKDKPVVHTPQEPSPVPLGNLLLLDKIALLIEEGLGIGYWTHREDENIEMFVSRVFMQSLPTGETVVMVGLASSEDRVEQIQASLSQFLQEFIPSETITIHNIDS